MKIKLILITPIIFGFTYCSTTGSLPNSTDTSIIYSVEQEAVVLESVRILLENGSLYSLQQAIILLEKESAGNTEQGKVLKSIAASLLRLVYPYFEFLNIRVSSPKTGMVAAIIERARKGIIIDIPNKEVSFFTLLLSSTAALYTDSDAVIDRSMEILDTIYSPGSRSFLYIYIKAYLFEQQKLFSKALAGYYAAWDIDEKSYPAQLGIVRILIINGEYKEALVSMERLFSLYGKNIEIFSLFIDALIENNELDKALSMVTNFLATNPNDITINLKYADILQKNGQNSMAFRILNTIEALDGSSNDSVRIRASILINEKNYDQAAVLLKVALNDYPDDSRLQSLYGGILLITGNEVEGNSYLDATHPDNLVLLTENAILAEDWILATDTVEKLLVRDDSDKYLRYAIKIYQNRGEESKALDFSTRIIEGDHPLFLDYTVYISLLLRVNKVEVAMKMLNIWLNASNSYIERSHFYYLKSLTQVDTREKLYSLQQALFENLENVDAIIAIADASYNLGEKRKSYRYLKQALILSPDDNQIKALLRKVEKEL